MFAISLRLSVVARRLKNSPKPLRAWLKNNRWGFNAAALIDRWLLLFQLANFYLTDGDSDRCSTELAPRPLPIFFAK
jgi:hypothetical protein